MNKAVAQKGQNSSNNTNTDELHTATNLSSCGPCNKSPGKNDTLWKRLTWFPLVHPPTKLEFKEYI